MEQFKLKWRAFTLKADKVLLSFLLALLYVIGFGLSRLAAALFMRKWLGWPSAGWKDKNENAADLEAAKRQS